MCFHTFSLRWICSRSCSDWSARKKFWPVVSGAMASEACRSAAIVVSLLVRRADPICGARCRNWRGTSTAFPSGRNCMRGGPFRKAGRLRMQAEKALKALWRKPNDPPADDPRRQAHRRAAPRHPGGDGGQARRCARAVSGAAAQPRAVREGGGARRDDALQHLAAAAAVGDGDPDHRLQLAGAVRVVRPCADGGERRPWRRHHRSHPRRQAARPA